MAPPLPVEPPVVFAVLPEVRPKELAVILVRVLEVLMAPPLPFVAELPSNVLPSIFNAFAEPSIAAPPPSFLLLLKWLVLILIMSEPDPNSIKPQLQVAF